MTSNDSNAGLSFFESIVQMPLMALPVRSTVIATATGKVLVSPGSQLTDSDFAKASGVTDIVGSNLFHCAGVKKAAKHFPQANTWCPPNGKTLKPRITWSHELSVDMWPYVDELPMVFLKGMPKVNECVFIHKPSKSLIVSDLFFNMLDINGLGAWLILNLFGTYNKFAMSKFFARAIQDRNQFHDSLSEVLSHDFENIIVSHGANIIGNGRATFIQALSERGFEF